MLSLLHAHILYTGRKKVRRIENINKNNEDVGMWEVRDEWRQLLCRDHDSKVNERPFFTAQYFTVAVKSG